MVKAYRAEIPPLVKDGLCHEMCVNVDWSSSVHQFGMECWIIAGCSKQLCFADPQWPTCAGLSLRALSTSWRAAVGSAAQTMDTRNYNYHNNTGPNNTLWCLYVIIAQVVTYYQYLMLWWSEDSTWHSLITTYQDSQTKPTLKCSSRQEDLFGEPCFIVQLTMFLLAILATRTSQDVAVASDVCNGRVGMHLGKN